MDRAYNDEERNPVGLILLSHFPTADPLWGQSVVVVIRHDDRYGTIGLCINHPLHLTLDDFGEDQWQSLDTVPVFRGGPVAPKHIIVTALSWDAAYQRLCWRLGLDSDLVRHLSADEPHLQFKAYCGHMNWGPGSLEDDIRQQKWLPIPLPSKKIFTLPNSQLWRALMLQFYPIFSTELNLPQHPSEN